MTTEQIIQKYPKIFQQYEGNPGMVNWYGLPKGWLPIIDILCGSIQRYVDGVTRYTKDGPKKPPQPTCTQMKEKFGGLRFYTNDSDDYVEGMIMMAEHMCDNTCQECGSNEDLGITKGWISVVCRKCVGEDNLYNWEPK